MRDWGEEVLFLQIPTCTHMSTAPPPPLRLAKSIKLHAQKCHMQHTSYENTDATPAAF